MGQKTAGEPAGNQGTVPPQAPGAAPQPSEGFKGYARLAGFLKRRQWYRLKKIIDHANLALWVHKNTRWTKQPATQGQLAALRRDFFGDPGQEIGARWQQLEVMIQEAHGNALASMQVARSAELRCEHYERRHVEHRDLFNGAIQRTANTFAGKIDAISALLEAQREDIEQLRSRVETLEDSAAALQRQIREMDTNA